MTAANRERERERERVLPEGEEERALLGGSLRFGLTQGKTGARIQGRRRGGWHGGAAPTRKPAQVPARAGPSTARAARAAQARRDLCGRVPYPGRASAGGLAETGTRVARAARASTRGARVRWCWLLARRAVGREGARTFREEAQQQDPLRLQLRRRDGVRTGGGR